MHSGVVLCISDQIEGVVDMSGAANRREACACMHKSAFVCCSAMLSKDRCASTQPKGPPTVGLFKGCSVQL
jgi:hypothetical protein